LTFEFERSGYYPDNGGFSEYVRMVSDLAWKIPDNISYEQAATVSVGLYSAAMCMTHPKNLGMTEWPGKVSNGQWASNIQHTAPFI
jgi:NADPH:quinone reductase-like Zn-dependent oxidoreductase